jgi:hypothetical protein
VHAGLVSTSIRNARDVRVGPAKPHARYSAAASPSWSTASPPCWRPSGAAGDLVSFRDSQGDRHGRRLVRDRGGRDRLRHHTVQRRWHCSTCPHVQAMTSGGGSGSPRRRPTWQMAREDLRGVRISLFELEPPNGIEPLTFSLPSSGSEVSASHPGCSRGNDGQSWSAEATVVAAVCCCTLVDLGDFRPGFP